MILYQNRDKLISFLENFQNDRQDDTQFNDEKKYLIKQIMELRPLAPLWFVLGCACARVYSHGLPSWPLASPARHSSPTLCTYCSSTAYLSASLLLSAFDSFTSLCFFPFPPFLCALSSPSPLPPLLSISRVSAVACASDGICLGRPGVSVCLSTQSHCSPTYHHLHYYFTNNGGTFDFHCLLNAQSVDS